MSIKKAPFVPYNSEGSKLPETDYVEGSEKTFPNSVAINPSPIEETGQEWYRGVRIQTERILEVLMSLLPSNYISQVKGPFYTLQLQSAAEQIAKIQVVAQEVYSDSDFDFTRPEFLYQILGGLVNPHYRDFTFKLDSDIEHRTFLKKMIVLLRRLQSQMSTLGTLHGSETGTQPRLRRQRESGCLCRPIAFSLSVLLFRLFNIRFYVFEKWIRLISV